MSEKPPPGWLFEVSVSVAGLVVVVGALVLAFRAANLGPPELSGERRAATAPAPAIEAAPAGNVASEAGCDGGWPGTDHTEGLSGRISYTCDGDAYVMELATGEVERLSHGRGLLRRLAWSPDGTKVAYTDHGADGIRVAVPDGESSRELGGAPAGDLEWSPDGRSIAFLGSARTGDEKGLVVVGAAGAGLRTIVSKDEDLKGRPIFELDWSPDGERILFETIEPSGGYVALYTIRADGTDLEQVFGNRVVKEISEPSQKYWDDIGYSPRGQEIAFVNNGTSDEDPEKRSQIFVMSAGGTNVRQLTTEPGEKFFASWSPDGEWLLYQNALYEQRDLWAISTNGAGKQKVTTTQPREEPSPNGMRDATWLPTRTERGTGGR